MNASTDQPALSVEVDNPVGNTARKLIGELCAEMSARYGIPPSPFSLDETAGPRTVFLVAWLHGKPIGCGALRPFDDDTAEIKRMYVVPTATHGWDGAVAEKFLNSHFGPVEDIAAPRFSIASYNDRVPTKAKVKPQGFYNLLFRHFFEFFFVYFDYFVVKHLQPANVKARRCDPNF
jgi:hypothetical protein